MPQKAIAKRDKRFVFIMPSWVIGTLAGWLAFCILMILSCSILMVAHGQVLPAVIYLALFAVITYRNGSYFVSLPPMLGAHGLVLKRQYGKIETSHRRAINVINKLPLPKDESYAGLFVNLGMSQVNQGKYDQAESSLQTAIGLFDKIKTKNRWNAVLARVNLASVYLRQQRLHDALVLYDDCEEKISTLPAAFNAYKVLVCLGRARALMQFQDTDEAESYYRQAMEIAAGDKSGIISKKSKPSFDFAFDCGLALICARRDDWQSSLKHCGQMLENAKANPKCSDVNSCYLICSIAEAYLDHELMEPAELVLELGYAWAQLEPTHPEAKRLLDIYARLLEASGRKDEVADMRAWIRPVEMPSARGLLPDATTAT